ncbi:MAG: hypothetical protein ACYCO3_11750 [Mycobacteriales bacterium]
MPISNWPAELRPPGSTGWQSSAVEFLFDCCPADYRSYELLRRHPVVLAYLARAQTAAAEQATVRALAGARSALADVVAPEVLEAAIGVCELEVRRLAELATAVAAIGAAFRAAT